MRNKLTLYLFSFFIGCAVVRADAGKPVTSPDTAPSDDDLRIREIFSSVLPRTEKKNSLKFTVHPHFGDFTRHDYLRIPVGARYGLTERWDVSTDVEGYLSHGLGDVAFGSKAGFSNFRVGTKYLLEKPIIPGWETAVGTEYSQPLGHPPPQITDGLRHYTTFATFAEVLNKHPSVRFFWGVNSDFVGKTTIAAEPQKNELRDNSVGVNSGFVWNRGRLNYTFETTFNTTRLVGDNQRDVFALRPGVIWAIPKRYTFNSRGQWLIGAGIRTSFGPDGTDVSFSAKLRLSFDLKRWLQKH